MVVGYEKPLGSRYRNLRNRSALTARKPDENLRLDETTGHWTITEPDWDEFATMVKGEGEIPDLRISTRRNAHAEGEWVREAAVAYAEKQQQRERVA